MRYKLQCFNIHTHLFQLWIFNMYYVHLYFSTTRVYNTAQAGLEMAMHWLAFNSISLLGAGTVGLYNSAGSALIS